MERSSEAENERSLAAKLNFVLLPSPLQPHAISLHLAAGVSIHVREGFELLILLLLGVSHGPVSAPNPAQRHSPLAPTAIHPDSPETERNISFVAFIC